MITSMILDTEPETSIDLDVSANQQVKTETCNLTKSVFNITLDNINHNDDENVDFENYETRLRHELREWETLWRKSYGNAKRAKQKHPAVDTSLLPAEQRAFLEQMPNLQKFLRESVLFRRMANMYLDTYYSETFNIQQNLIDICEHKQNMFKRNKVEEWLANYKK